MTTIELSDDDARLFAEFQRHHDAIRDIIENGAMEVRNGTATLHFDQNGVMQRVDIEQVVYRRKPGKLLDGAERATVPSVQP